MLTRLQQIFQKSSNHLRTFISRPEAWSDRMGTLLIFAAITIISFASVRIFYQLISFPLMERTVLKSGSAVKDNISDFHRSTLQSYGIITERNLFNTTLKAVSDKQPGGGLFASGPEVSAYELKGTIAGDAAFGFAILEERANNKQIIRRLGDMVGSAKLINITRNTAVLRSGGRDVTLKIKETTEGSLFSPPGASGKVGKITLSRKEVIERLSDLNTVLTQALVRPYIADGKQEGFVISEIKPDSLYSRLGLMNGDIIIDVNNKRLQSADDILQLVNLMQSGGQISLNLQRGGRTETLNYFFH